MKKLTLLFLTFCSFICASFVSLSAYAETIIFLAPMRLDLTEEQPVSEIRVTNTSSIGRGYNVSAENLIMTEDGVTQRVDDFEYSAKRMLRFVPRSFDLQPGQTQIVRVMARISKDTPDGEFHSHLEFLENIKRRGELNQNNSGEDSQERAAIKAQLAYSAAIPVTISKGQVSTQLEMQNVVFARNEKGEPVINLDILRSGNGQGDLYLDANYVAPDGTESPAASRRTVYVYREIDVRRHSFVLNLLTDKGVPSSGQIRVKLFNRDVSADEPVQEVLVPLS